MKGDICVLIDGGWHLRTREGYQTVKPCPLDETKLVALHPHDAITARAKTARNQGNRVFKTNDAGAGITFRLVIMTTHLVA